MKIKKKGFTLAELLVVVAIIGILVAVSIPIFAGQAEKAREATDAANERSAKAAASAKYLTDEKYGIFFYDAVSGTLEDTYTDITAYGKAKAHINKIVRCTLSNTGDLTLDWTIGGIDDTVDLGTSSDGSQQTTLTLLFDEVLAMGQKDSSLKLNNGQRIDSNAASGSVTKASKADTMRTYLATTLFSSTNVKTWAVKNTGHVDAYVTDVDVNAVTIDKDQIRTMKYYYDSAAKTYKYSIGYTTATSKVVSGGKTVTLNYVAINDTGYTATKTFDSYEAAVEAYNAMVQIK